MRLMAWNCAMAFHRKFAVVLDQRPDIAVIGECAAPDVLAAKADLSRLGDVVWVGENPYKGLAVFGRNGYRIRLDDLYDPTLRHLAPVHVEGDSRFRLLAAWAQNFSDGITRKAQPGPFRVGLEHYRRFLIDGPAVVAGDLNNNSIWDRPGWRVNHADAVACLDDYGLVSVYHEMRQERHGEERTPTIYWRDRRLDGPRYHLDYVFAPRDWLAGSVVRVGSYRKWVGSGLSDHVPVIVDVDLG